MYTQHRNFPFIYMFSAGQSHLVIHIPETVGIHRPSFQEWVMSFESKLYLVNPILASSPRIDVVVHIFGSADIFSLWYRLIKE